MTPGSRRTILAVIVLLLLILFWQTRRGPQSPILSLIEGLNITNSGSRPPFYPGVAKPPGSNYTRILVLPKTKHEDVEWIHKKLPGMRTAIYEVDNLFAEFRVPRNKGHEAMIYLTYIIDHYDKLPDTIIFIHAHKSAWHNNVLLDLDAPTTIKRLSDDRVARQGYVNLRCHHDPGCPDWIHLDRPEVDFDMEIRPEEKRFSFELFQELFPGHRPPPVLSQPCCAQFAVSGERIRDNPKSLYEHLRTWLVKTTLEDEDSGRIFEYIWHYLFTRNAEYCPSMNTCYCDGFGICFGGAAKLNNWLTKLKERERLDDEIDAALERKEKQGPMKELLKKRLDLVNELLEEKAKAYERGEMEQYRAMERERLPSLPYS